MPNNWKKQQKPEEMQWIPDSEMDSLEREERCRKAIKTIARAIVMRFLVMGLLCWAVFSAEFALWSAGLVLFVLIINLSGLIPLGVELKKRCKELKRIIAEAEE